MQRKIAKMVNVSNAAQRKATSSSSCEEASSTEELEQHVDVLLLDQAGDHFFDQVTPRRVESSRQESELYNFQPLILDLLSLKKW